MAELPVEDREKILCGLMRYWSSIWERIPVIDRDELLAAVGATDTWIENNQVSYNQALPEPARTNLTQGQKTLIFCAVALARVSIEFLRKVFGGVD